MIKKSENLKKWYFIDLFGFGLSGLGDYIIASHHPSFDAWVGRVRPQGRKPDVFDRLIFGRLSSDYGSTRPTFASEASPQTDKA